MTFFRPKKHSKNIVFASFFIKNDSKTRIFTLKNEQKSMVFAILGVKLHMMAQAFLYFLFFAGLHRGY